MVGIHVTRFQTDHAIVQISSPHVLRVSLPPSRTSRLTIGIISQRTILFHGLHLVSRILTHCTTLSTPSRQIVALVRKSGNNLRSPSTAQILQSQTRRTAKGNDVTDDNGSHRGPPDSDHGSKLSSQIGILPQSVLHAMSQVQRSLSPGTRRRIIGRFHDSQSHAATTVQFLLLLIVIPLLARRFAGAFLIKPIISRFHRNHRTGIFLGVRVRRRTLRRLRQFRRQLQFRILVNGTPPLSRLGVRHRIQRGTARVRRSCHRHDTSTVGGVFTSVITTKSFTLLLVAHGRSITGLGSFVSRVICNLDSDTGTFVVVLFASIFIKFRSPRN